MPPRWLIIRTIVIIGLTSAADRMILKPRGTTLVVDGKPVSVRRKRDTQLLMAVILGMLLILFTIGVALIEEGDLLVILLSAVPGAGLVVWSLWRAARTDDSLPGENDVRVGICAGSLTPRHA